MAREAGRTRLIRKIVHPDPAAANAEALAALSGDADGLALVFEGSAGAEGAGLPVTEDALETVLAGVPLDRVHLRLEPHPASRASADALLSLLTRRQVDPARLSLSFGIDPASVYAATGRLRMSVEALQASMPQSLAHFFAIGVPGVLLEADGRAFHNAGADAAAEIGTVLAIASAHLKLFEEARQALIYAAPHIGFALSLTEDIASSAAKIEALRQLWTKLQEHWGIAPHAAIIHAETSWRCRDRTVVDAAAAKAALAGAFSFTPRGPIRLAEATAVEATAGSVERLTDAAWQAFQQIESEGGIWTSLTENRLQARIAATADASLGPLQPLALVEMAA